LNRPSLERQGYPQPGAGPGRSSADGPAEQRGGYELQNNKVRFRAFVAMAIIPSHFLQIVIVFSSGSLFFGWGNAFFRYCACFRPIG
jgi:hypothetical protein